MPKKLDIDSRSTPIPAFTCTCGEILDITVGVTGERLPKSGDLSLCINCGRLAMWLPGLEGVEEPSAQTLEQLRTRQPLEWQLIQIAQKAIREREAEGKAKE